MSGDAIRLDSSRVSESARRGKGLHDSTRDISRQEELRVEEIARRVEIEALWLAELRVASRMPRTWSKTLESLANPLESLRVRLQAASVCRQKGQ